MSFISFQFLALILISSLLYYLFPKKYRYLVLVVANIYFYISSCKFHSIYLLISIISVYFFGLIFTHFEALKSACQLEHDAKKAYKKRIKKQERLALIVTIAINLGLLLVLKYDNFFGGLINDIFHSSISLPKFILPLGISYYTLMAISYVVDVYNGKYEASKDFFAVFLYLSFFPLMVEGPIARFNETSSSLKDGHSFNYQQYCNALLRITWGFIKKLVIADRAALFVNQVFGSNETGLAVIMAIVLYVLQIYAEFSGAMDIVLGTAKLYGIDLPENFNTPFFSRNIGEFWRRWHITLGTWLKDYIFYPISISKTNLKLTINTHKHLKKSLADFISMAFPLLFVWLIMGFWHGASYKYILYGIYYYLLMLLGLLLKPLTTKIDQILKVNTACFSYHLYESLRTFFFVAIGMTIFRADTLSEAFTMFKNIFGPNSANIAKLLNGYANLTIIIVTTIAILIISTLKYFNINIFEKLNNQNLIFKYFIYLIAILFLLIFGQYGYGYDPSSFIYGGF